MNSPVGLGGGTRVATFVTHRAIPRRKAPFSATFPNTAYFFKLLDGITSKISYYNIHKKYVF
jgi:hypothetical protein